MARGNAMRVPAVPISDEQSAHDAAAAAYDAWFRAEVEAGLREADDPNTVWHAQKDLNREFKKLRQELRVRIDKGKPAAAIRIVGEIERHTRLLRDTPEIGRLGRVAGTRELVIARTPFVVIYRIRNREIQILRLLHVAQWWPPLEVEEF
jgi:toxin ParE1/3/4